MLQTSARLLRLLALLQARRFWAGPELAERLEVTERTVRRDVDRLRSLGYPVDATSGVAGGYQLGAGATLPPLLLEDDEALAVAVALGTSASGTVAGIEEASLRALSKLENVLPKRLRGRIDALRTSVVLLERSGPRIDSASLSILATACRERLSVRFQYTDRTAKPSERAVEPLGLVHTGHRWYLVVWDLGRSDFRTFRVDRIGVGVLTGARFAPRPLPDDGDLRAYVSRSVSTSVYAHQAQVLLHAPLERIRKIVPPSAAFLERVSPERTRMTAGAPSLEGLAVWIAMMGVDFDVEEPAELVQHLSRLHERIGRTLGKKGRRAAGPRRL